MSMDRQRTAKGQVWEPHGLSPHASAKWPLLFSGHMECLKYISSNGIFLCVWSAWLSEVFAFSTTSATVIRAQMSFITQRLRLHLFNLLVVSMGFIVFKTVINRIHSQCKPCFFIRDYFIGNLLDSVAISCSQCLPLLCSHSCFHSQMKPFILIKHTTGS